MSEKKETLKEIVVTHKVFGPVGGCSECLLEDIRIVDQVVEVALWYPPWNIEEYSNSDEIDAPNPHTVEVGLVALRSVPAVRIRYSYARNGWVVLAGRWVESVNEQGYPTTDEVFEEVVFVPT